ncbi:MAG: Na+ cotransporter [Devosia sp.]|uniref:Na/Pi cotransporter family protein n=1 Tax=Devosia sp. TaxID=1871048 RepID=UPI00262EF45A|nr:Na/Pi cotransporter family protein [Devosia sp.]MDB5588862.1 Na+ cotransporter [Devosia sp.]
MTLSLIVLHMAGATMLLLYAMHMVRMGMELAFGHTLRVMLGQARRGELIAAGGGLAMAVMLQSSTAVAMLACGFAASGMLAAPTGLALLLGADIGSALVVRILTFDLGWLVPVCLFVGGIMHLKLSGERVREVGRMVLGIGFVLLSLQLIAAAIGPLRNSTMLPALSDYLASDYFTAFLIGAAFTWLVHSSVATILMVAALAAQGLIPLEAGVPLVLGANLGGGLIAVWLSRGLPVAGRRLPVGNLIFRATGAIVVLAVVGATGLSAKPLGADAGTALVNFHLLFNAGLALVSLPLVRMVSHLTLRLLPDRPVAATPGNPMAHRTSALDRSAKGTPQLALASATRELLRMGELVEAMVRPVLELIRAGDRAAICRVREMDEAVNDAHTAIKLYLAELGRGQMTVQEAKRSIELTDVAINFEHAGDVIAKNLLVLAQERLDKNWRFSNEGWAELVALHERLIENMHLALNLLVTQNLSSARQLVVEKERMRRLHRHSHSQHLKRLQSGTPESIETSGMHIEIARGLKEINSLLVTIAYPILTESGDLLESRLTKVG